GGGARKRFFRGRKTGSARARAPAAPRARGRGPAVNAKMARTSAVPMTATTFSMRSSRDRAAWTWAATAVPQDGQRPPGLRTRGVPHVGQSTWRRTGTRGTVADAGRQAKAGEDASLSSGGVRLYRPGGVRLLHLRGVRLPQLVVLGLLGPQDDHLPTRLGLGTLLDGAQAPTQVLGLDTEHIADILKGEDPAIVVALDPLLRILEELLATRIARSREFAEHIDGIFEHCDHQAALAIVLGPASDPIEVLRGEHRVRREEAGDPVFCSRCDVAIFH